MLAEIVAGILCLFIICVFYPINGELMRVLIEPIVYIPVLLFLYNMVMEKRPGIPMYYLWILAFIASALISITVMKFIAVVK